LAKLPFIIMMGSMNADFNYIASFRPALAVLCLLLP
jgi:hypothetical protein